MHIPTFGLIQPRIVRVMHSRFCELASSKTPEVQTTSFFWTLQTAVENPSAKHIRDRLFVRVRVHRELLVIQNIFFCFTWQGSNSGGREILGHHEKEQR
jgi:hypothetical protein